MRTPLRQSRLRRRRRWPAFVPVLVGAAALGWLLPLPAVVVLALVAVPGVATAGDWLGGATGRALPRRFAHHSRVAASTVTTPLALVGGSVVLAVLLDRLDPSTVADDVLAGGAGALAAAVVIVPAGAGSVAGRWIARCTGRVLIGAWVTAALVALGALCLQPDLVPFPG